MKSFGGKMKRRIERTVLMISVSAVIGACEPSLPGTDGPREVAVIDASEETVVVEVWIEAVGAEYAVKEAREMPAIYWSKYSIEYLRDRGCDDMGWSLLHEDGSCWSLPCWNGLEPMQDPDFIQNTDPPPDEYVPCDIF